MCGRRAEGQSRARAPTIGSGTPHGTEVPQGVGEGDGVPPPPVPPCTPPESVGAGPRGDAAGGRQCRTGAEQMCDWGRLSRLEGHHWGGWGDLVVKKLIWTNFEALPSSNFFKSFNFKDPLCYAVYIKHGL